MATHFDLEEQEQIEQLRHFWQRWGRALTSALTGALLLGAGWMAWQQWQSHRSLQAAVLAQAVEQSLTQQQSEQAAQAFAELGAKYPSTVQAFQAALWLAAASAEAGRLDEARSSLEWLLQHGDAGHRPLARLRLSAVLQEQGQHEEALAVLEDGQLPASFAAAVADRRGDIHAARGERTQAVEQYRKAWAELSREGPHPWGQVIEVKLNALGAEPPRS